MVKFQMFRVMLKERILGNENFDVMKNKCKVLAKELGLRFKGCYLNNDLEGHCLDVNLKDNDGLQLIVVVDFD